jgi:iron-sulfur cluster protein
VRFWNTTFKYSAETPEQLWIVPCCFIGDPDVGEIGSAATAAGFSAIWFGPDFQAFRQAHLNGKVPDYCRNCYRSPDKRQQAVDASIADASAA